MTALQLDATDRTWNFLNPSLKKLVKRLDVECARNSDDAFELLL